MSEPAPRISAAGDGAVLVTYEERIDPGINDTVRRLAERLRAARRAGVPWLAPVAAYASVLARFDPLRMSLADAEARLREMLDTPPEDSEFPTAPRQVHHVPVRYGGVDGPDLDVVAARTGMTPARVVELHSAQAYRAYMLGFAPGFAYLGTLPAELQLPRRATPRQRVPPGSVAIAGLQTAVYPLATPGGWHVIGRTDVRMWDVARDPPALIGPGDEVRFVPAGGDRS